MKLFKKWIIEQVQDGVFYAGSNGAHGTVWTSNRENATRYNRRDADDVGRMLIAAHGVAIVTVGE